MTLMTRWKMARKGMLAHKAIVAYAAIAALGVTAIGAAAGTGIRLAHAASINSANADEAGASEAAVPNEPAGNPGSTVGLDRSGRRQVGKASFYAARYSGRTMADGTPMRLYSNNAASVTLPLGTTARVTNLGTGKSAIIQIRDRGPYVKGRIVDLSPATARLIGLSRKQGLATVEVLPLSLPARKGGSVLAAMNARNAAAHEGWD